MYKYPLGSGSTALFPLLCIAWRDVEAKFVQPLKNDSHILQHQSVLHLDLSISATVNPRWRIDVTTLYLCWLSRLREHLLIFLLFWEKQVDEKGAEAVAVTAVYRIKECSRSTAKPEVPIKFVVDHPFFFCILSPQANTTLRLTVFAGHCTLPVAKNRS